MAPSIITEAEILDALATAAQERGQGPKDARTVEQLAQTTNQRPEKVRAALGHLKKAGRLLVHRVPQERLDGSVRVVPAYTILPAKRK